MVCGAAQAQASVKQGQETATRAPDWNYVASSRLKWQVLLGDL